MRYALYLESITRLESAIALFGSLSEYGSDHPEVGDCYCLLGRTHFSAGDVKLAWQAAHEARRLIVDVNSKDYLDLRILEGELWASETNEWGGDCSI